MNCADRSREKCLKCRDYAGMFQLGGTIFLTILKVVVGILGNSKGLLADAIHSAANIVTTAAIFVSRHFGDQPADDDHNFGHGKIEFVASALVSIFLLVGTVFVIYESLDGIIHGKIAELPHWTVIIVGVISVIVNETLFHYLQCVGNEFKSNTLLTNSWAIRSDSFSSFAVILGVIATRMGFTHADGYVALAVAVIIIYICIKMLIDSVKSLLDRSIPFDQLEKLRLAANRVAGRRLDSVIARFNGRNIWVNVTLVMDKEVTVEEWTQLTQDISDSVKSVDKHVDKVLVDYSV
jgi:cation diffusion facilitator family transporter